MMPLIFGTILPWLLIAIGTWLGYQLVRQNGRILLRLDSLGRIASELLVGAEALLQLIEISAIQPSKKPGKSLKNSAPHGKEPHPSLARSRLKRDGLKTGDKAPEFRLPRIEGGELALEDFRGEPVLLVFSDPECGQCDELAPHLQQIHEQRSDLKVLMISRKEAKLNVAKAARLGLTFPIVLQKRWGISLQYAMFATPIGYLIDEQGI